MSDFIPLTKIQVEYLYHKLNYDWNQTFKEYLKGQNIDPDEYHDKMRHNGEDVGYNTWMTLNNMLEGMVGEDPNEVVAGFLIKRKVR